MKLSLLKKGRHNLLSSNSPRLHLPGIIPPLRSPVLLPACRIAKCGGDLLEGMLLLMMLKASIVEILAFNNIITNSKPNRRSPHTASRQESGEEV